VQDVVFFVAFALVYGTAGYVTYRMIAHAPLAALAAPFVFVATAIVPVALVHRLLPSIEPGIYRVKERAFLWWILRWVFQRQLNLWPVRQVLFYSHALRWMLLNALGSRVGFTTLMSSDVVLTDWQMLRAGAGCSVGGLARLYTHFMHGDRLIIGRIHMGDEVDVAGDVVIGPHVRIEDGARIAFRATIAPFARIGAGAVIHEDAVIGERAVIGEGAVVESRAIVAAGASIGARERWGGSPATKIGEVRVRREAARAASAR
jgi:acetyltransferase-like isoleucine patch superfamily enzyme